MDYQNFQIFERVTWSFWQNNHDFSSLYTTAEYFKSFFHRKKFWDQITDKIYGDSLKVMQVFCYDTANVYLYILHIGWFWKTKQWWETKKAGKPGVDKMAEVVRHFSDCYSKRDVCLFKLNVCWSKKKNNFLLRSVCIFINLFYQLIFDKTST